MDVLRILVLGDVVGEPGRQACKAILPRLRQEEKIDLIVANVENIAGGSGLTEPSVRELFDCGVDAMTSGDHAFRKKEGEALFRNDARIIRPANYPAAVPGRGSMLVETRSGLQVGIVNLLGRVFLKPLDCPFEAARREVEKLRRDTRVILVDFHAEASSEKMALGWFLDGKVSAVYGTHTHVATADEQILPHGTGYATDIGMCGPFRSVIGREIDDVLKLFLTQMPVRLEVATEDPRISGLLLDIDPQNGKTLEIRRVQERMPCRVA